MKSSFRTSPAVRYWVRVIVVSAIGYASTVFTTVAVDEFDGRSFLWGLGGAIFAGLAYALIGGTTPVEPFVGINKTPVEVPSPPAIPETGP